MRTTRILVTLSLAVLSSATRAETIDEAMREQYRGSESYCDVDPRGGRACVNLTGWCSDKSVRTVLTIEECVREKRAYLMRKNHEEWENWKKEKGR